MVLTVITLIGKLSVAICMLVLSGITSARAHDPQAIPDMLEQVLPGVVSIQTSQVAKDGKALPKLPEGSPFQEFYKEFFDKKGEEGAPGKPGRVHSLGSGFIIDASGFVVTNNHVVAEADEIEVVLSDGTKLKAEIAGRDAPTDIALLRVKPDKPLTAVKLGDSSRLRVGEQVLAVGNPFGLGGSVSSGIVSGLGRDINAGAYDKFIQTDATMNRGNTGGPLINLAGDVVGLNTSIMSPTGGSTGVGFAIPSNTVASVTTALAKSGTVERGWIGVQIQNVTKDIAEALELQAAAGALVNNATPAGPADLAGVTGGDVIIEVNGVKIQDSRHLAREVAKLTPEERATLVVWREKKRKTISVVLGTRPGGSTGEKSPSDGAGDPLPASGSLKLLGMTIGDLDAEARKKFSIPASVSSGVIITKVDSSGDAAEKGLRAGHVIQEVQQEKATSASVVGKVLQEAAQAARKSALFTIADAKGTKRFVALKLDGLKIESANTSEAGTKPDTPANEPPSVKELEDLQ